MTILECDGYKISRYIVRFSAILKDLNKKLYEGFTSGIPAAASRLTNPSEFHTSIRARFLE